MNSWWQESRTTAKELALLRQQIQAAEAELVEREAELIDLRVELSAFRLRYEVQVGRKLEALEQIEAAIARCTERIQAYRQWGAQGPPKGRGNAAYVSVQEQYRRTWQEPVSSGPSFPPPPDPELVGDLRKLYRQLCRKFHPDLTQDPRERAWRTEMMAAVNAAYEAHSLVELQSLAAQSYTHGDEPQGADRQRLKALRQKLAHIRASLDRANQEINDLVHGSLMELSLEVKLAAKNGQDLLAEMGAEVERDLERKRVELDFLQAQLRQLGIECE
jgi:septal ring factor EnvC (AmiA/AmiB activator)